MCSRIWKSVENETKKLNSISRVVVVATAAAVASLSLSISLPPTVNAPNKNVVDSN